MTLIESRHNIAIRRLRSLADAKVRKATGLFLVEGRKQCEEALRDASVEMLLVDSARADDYAALLDTFPDALLAPTHVVASACESKTPQGVVAAVHIPPPLVPLDVSGPLLALDGVQDPGNVGTMLRTAEAAGFSGALLSATCADPFAPKTARASMGSALRLPLLRGDLCAQLIALKAQGAAVLSAELCGVDIRLKAPNAKAPFVLIIGGEGSGVSREVSALANARVSLPMRGRAESLNAAVAAGILMYMLTAERDISGGL